MAVIEIGKIQVRRGQENQTGVPQLDGGEFAWAADTERLYIGLRRADGGSRDDNVEILTENHLKNFFQVSYTSSTYIYKEGTLLTAPLDDPFNETQRTVQEKLDDQEVSVKDFGVIGNNTTTGVLQWDMARLQLAVDRLFLDTQDLNTTTTHPRRILRFPAGIYNFTSTLYIPAYTTIVGEGPGKTIFNLTTTTAIADSLIKTIDYSSAGGSNGYKHFDSGSGSGSDFSSTSSAKFITIKDLTMQFDVVGTTTANAMSLLSLDCAENSVIKNVEFKGNYNFNSAVLPSVGYVGINLRGKQANGTLENVEIDNCIFTNLRSGLRSNYDIKNVKITNNRFENLVRGVNFSDSTQGYTGPRYVVIEKNNFDYIEQQAIYVGIGNQEGLADPYWTTGSYIVSRDNTFERVGFTSPWGDLGQTATSIITFLASECSSIDDRFRRAEIHNALAKAQSTAIVYYPELVEGHTVIESSYVSSTVYPRRQFATDPQTKHQILRFPFDVNNVANQHIKIDYEVYVPVGREVINTVTNTVVAENTVTVFWTSNTIFQGYLVPIPGKISPATRVVEMKYNTSQIVLSKPVTLNSMDEIICQGSIDRVGDLEVTFHEDLYNDHLGFVSDSFNFVTWDPYSLWSVEVNNTGGYCTLLLQHTGIVSNTGILHYSVNTKK